MSKLAVAVMAASCAALVAADTPWVDTPRQLQALRALAADQGEKIWPGFGKAPFGFLVLEGQREVLLCRDGLPDGFTADGLDPMTGCARAIRPRQAMPATMLAAMPLFGPPSTIVMGPAPADAAKLPRWRSTVLHEHFHQWQAELPAYYDRTKALDLANGDETGMWMLNFPFPYGDRKVQAAYGSAARALVAAVEARGTAAFDDRLADYLDARRAFASAAGERNWRYLEFQFWAEGVARWTEIALARQSGQPEMIADAGKHEANMLDMLRAPDLAKHERVMVYPYGMAEALLMDACGPGWRAAYPKTMALGPILQSAAASCGKGHSTP